MEILGLLGVSNMPDCCCSVRITDSCPSSEKIYSLTQKPIETLTEDATVLPAVPTHPSVHVAYLTAMQLEHTIWLQASHLGCRL